MPPTSLALLDVGTQIDNYELIERLGSGYSSAVWKAKVLSKINGVDLAVGEEVAIKIYNPDVMGGFESLRIQREYRVASSMQHDHLVQVHDLVISPSRAFGTFMVMDYAAGPTLKQHISDEGRLDLSSLIRVASQLFSALDALHKKNVYHRDVKPANIIVISKSEIVIKLVDLGIVSVSDDPEITMGSKMLGSKHTAPLEQLSGEPIDQRADIYSAGATLFQCMTGNTMYREGSTEGAIVSQMLRSPVTASETENFSANDLVKYGPNSAKSMSNQMTSLINACISVEKDDRPLTVKNCISLLSKLRQQIPKTEQLHPDLSDSEKVRHRTRVREKKKSE